MKKRELWKTGTAAALALALTLGLVPAFPKQVAAAEPVLLDYSLYSTMGTVLYPDDADDEDVAYARQTLKDLGIEVEESDSASYDGYKIVITKPGAYELDEEFAEDIIGFSAGASGATLDLNGHEIGSLYAEDAVTISGNGKVQVLGDLQKYPRSKITITGGTYTNWVGTAGTLNISGGEFTVPIYLSETGTLNISGGTFTGNFMDNEGTVNISGGTFNLPGPAYLYEGHVTLAGGTFTLTDTSYYDKVFIMYGTDTTAFTRVLASGCEYSVTNFGAAAGGENSDDYVYLQATSVTIKPRKGIVEGVPGTMYRMYNPNSGEHFYTAKVDEARNLQNVGWDYEGYAWVAPVSSNTPVYRLYNPNSGEHHYTVEAGERDFLIGLGWKDEGIGWYSDDSKTVPLYRLYNPNATGTHEAGAHHYTKETSERDNLIAIGWKDEGTGWYGK